jgi:hypothetical protein
MLAKAFADLSALLVRVVSETSASRKRISGLSSDFQETYAIVKQFAAFLGSATNGSTHR